MSSSHLQLCIPRDLAHPVKYTILLIPTTNLTISESPNTATNLNVACVHKTSQLQRRTALHDFKHLHVPEVRVMFRSMSSGITSAPATPNSHTAGHLLHVLDIQLQIYESHGTKLGCHDKWKCHEVIRTEWRVGHLYGFYYRQRHAALTASSDSSWRTATHSRQTKEPFIDWYWSLPYFCDSRSVY